MLLAQGKEFLSSSVSQGLLSELKWKVCTVLGAFEVKLLSCDEVVNKVHEALPQDSVFDK